VENITALLSEHEEWAPQKLASNRTKSFQGSIIHGSGFILDESEVASLIQSSSKNSEVIFPYLGGKDFNTSPDLRPSRNVVCFWDWPEEKAQNYTDVFKIIEERVKPDRQKRKANGDYKLRKPLPQRWWQYGEKRPGLYHALGKGKFFLNHPDGWTGHELHSDLVLACSEVTKHVAFAFVQNSMIFSDRIDVFPGCGLFEFAALQSSAHDLWARRYSSRLGQTLKYSIGNAFETFPLPSETSSASLSALAERYVSLRGRIMLHEQIGLTEAYNHLHDKSQRGAIIEEFRDVVRELDLAVMRSYGWHDIDSQYDYYELSDLPENDRTRFTISEEARREILHRLAELNRKRYQEEVNQGLQGDLKSEKTLKPSKPPKKASPKAAEPSIGLDLPEPPQPTSDDKKDALLAFLRFRPGRHGRGNLFGVKRMTITEFSSAMEELISEGLVVRDGTAPNETYMISERGKNG
jgi:hypothetical protein